MRKLLFLLAFIAVSATLSAQQTNKIYLKNGSEINGVILEQVPGKSIKIKTRDGSVFVYDMSEVDHIGQSEQSPTSGSDLQQQKHRGLDLTIGVGPTFGLQKGGGTAFMADLEVGKKFSKNVYAGLGGGVITGGGQTNFPVFAAFRYYAPLENSKLTPMFSLRGGYEFYESTIGDNSGCPFVEVMPGVQFPLSPSIDANFGLGYMASFSDGNMGHSLGIRLGFGIHNSTGGTHKKAETRQSGLQYEIGGTVMIGQRYRYDDGSDDDRIGYYPYGGAAISYKWDKNISFGLGFEYLGRCSYGGQSIFQTIEDGVVTETESRKGTLETSNYDALKLFLRGRYRLNDKTASPFASLDLGFIKSMKDNSDESEGEIRKSILFINPAVGYSFRVAANSYLEVKLGYQLGGKFLKDKTLREGETFRSMLKGVGLNGFTGGITFVHTTKLFQR